MNILYIGDIYGEPGIRVVSRVLPSLRNKHKIDLVIAQAENVSEGRGMLPEDRKKLQQYGVDFFTGGNWSLFRPESLADLSDPNIPTIRPANYPEGIPGKSWKEIDTTRGKVLVISLLGKIVGKDADKPVDNPLQVVDDILEDTKHVKYVAKVVNLHGDYSSEKVVIGYYLDGRASLVVGDHWHVPTADALVLPKGTAHITDVGMCGVLHSSLGVKLESIIERWRHGTVNKNVMETEGPLQFNAVLVETKEKTGLAKSIKQIQKII
jgi:hypothetical protein